MQPDDEGRQHSLVYLSRKLNAEELYFQALLGHVVELLAVIHALRVIKKNYLLGSGLPRPVGCLTDSQAIK